MQPPSRKLKVKVWRGSAAGGAYVHYEVPLLDSQTVLDVVTWIQRNIEQQLSYRFSCRVGMCGSCAMTVNGIARWTCRSHVSNVTSDNHLTIEPLKNLPVIRDLVCDMSAFFRKWDSAMGRFHPSTDRHADIAPIKPDSPTRQAADAGIECINCAVCYSSCDVVSWNSDYLGPAALNRAWTLINDDRDDAHAERLAAVSKGGGCHNCHSHQSCSTYCPVELNPTASIAGLKLATVRAAIKGEV